MNAESNLFELSEIFVNENKKDLDEIRQKLENLIREQYLEVSNFDKRQINQILNDLNQTTDWQNKSQKLDNILKKISESIPQGQEVRLKNKIIYRVDFLYFYFLQLKINYILSKVVETWKMALKNDSNFILMLSIWEIELEKFIEILETQVLFQVLFPLFEDFFEATEYVLKALLAFLKSNLVFDLKNKNDNQDQLRNTEKKVNRLILAILEILNYLKQEKEKTEPYKDTDTFKKFIKRLYLTPEEQLEKNKPAMRLLEKWMKENREMNEEAREEAREDFERFKEIIDAERPEGYKLYSDT
ncbi:hypothetical protein PCC7424_1322 [Gloeothece citriformis PCC 7424]|uniref:Uncharacterized protein n=1 Tax=Gloeothece citriformis (strain PCC 7424) TaxID=65393 RepID=B7K7J9_GLOC7|nr:hypothetical protein [Gloeothece citriformis]ACK69767.1 hypothetical protein PCC7424_1322 [Gloeothece citriformis PCC 7424]